jgi:hypothetical protein
MMGQIFLGKPLHWALIAAVIAIGWVLGEERLHVIWFNLFTVILLAVAAALVIAVILTSKPGERVTRDPLEEE